MNSLKDLTLLNARINNLKSCGEAKMKVEDLIPVLQRTALYSSIFLMLLISYILEDCQKFDCSEDSTPMSI